MDAVPDKDAVHLGQPPVMDTLLVDEHSIALLADDDAVVNVDAVHLTAQVVAVVTVIAIVHLRSDNSRHGFAGMETQAYDEDDQQSGYHNQTATDTAFRVTTGGREGDVSAAVHRFSRTVR